ncbi:protein SODIUM POTASSIUM ROOT DEFECTIVE 2-like [Bidens hawaiensis]|uniref:protein SODIUM POTASSIUM ROOT DEFECTIVE 2-like n=1 Tax=Bidens hawaiensis TaxID=980011 RepID=UPI004049B144
MTHETTQVTQPTMNATHILCARATNSNATTTTMEPNIGHQPSTNGGPAIDRHNPIIQDQTRLTKTILKISNKDQYKDNNKKSKHSIGLADETNDEKLVTNSNNNNININVVRRQGGVLFGWGCTRPSDFISPASSSRFLLTDKPLSDQFAPILKHGTPQTPQHQPPPPPEEKVKSEDDESSKKNDDDNASSSPVKNSSDHQVVVLRVSLHCRGCVKKMRKHLSKMEGVTSFTIDFMAKTVTVVGDITPLAVLMSVSKVKNAKLLTPTTISSPLEPRVELNLLEVDQNLGLVA